MGSLLTSPRTARWMVALGAVALFVFVFFFKWYGENIEGLAPGTRLQGATLSSTGWQTFTFSRWIWLLTILVALGSVVASAVEYELDAPVSLSALVAGLGTLASALIIFRIANHPGPSASGGSLRVSYEIKPGIWFGLIAALAIAFGGYLQTRPSENEPAGVDAPEDPGEAFSGLTVRGDGDGDSEPPSA
jgi:hypothetical protein